MRSGSLLIRGGRIIDPGFGVDMVGDLLIVGGVVAWVGEGGDAFHAPGGDVLIAAGMIVTPGFVDLHCHLREPGFEDKETVASGTEAAARGGFTSVCCMPNTCPPIDTPAMVEFVRGKADRDGRVRVFPIGCITKGQQGEELTDMDGLAEAGVVAFSDDGKAVPISPLMKKALECGGRLDLPIIDHCEDTLLTAGGVMNDGSLATRLGLRGVPAAAEESIVERDIELARVTGARIHIAHVSTAGSVDLIRSARQDHVDVTAEATPHHLVLTEERVDGYDTKAKVNPPLRTRGDAEAVIRGLREGVIQAVATDHAPHTAEDKTGDFKSAAFGISGLETALGVLLSLVHQGKLDLTTLVERLTAGPVRVLQSRSRSCAASVAADVPVGLGTLRIGAPGDVTVFDPTVEWRVDPALFASKGKNNPWAECLLEGKVMATAVGGELVYKDESVSIETGRR
jgi:dihydroorotase